MKSEAGVGSSAVPVSGEFVCEYIFSVFIWRMMFFIWGDFYGRVGL